MKIYSNPKIIIAVLIDKRYVAHVKFLYCSKPTDQDFKWEFQVTGSIVCHWQ